MKKYQSHKIVEAVQIANCAKGDDGSCHAYVEPHGDHVRLPGDFFDRGWPGPGDYLVRYHPDGYLSWSPKAVFEAGYREVSEPGTPAAVEVTVTAPAGKRAIVNLLRPEGADHMWAVLGGQSQTWSLVGDEVVNVCLGDPQNTVASRYGER